MSRKFVTARELSFIDGINRELIQEVVGQEVLYYSLMVEGSEVNDIYGEAIRKTWAPPVRVNALVNYDNPSVRSTAIGVDSDYSLEVYFHSAELRERNVEPREGDFLEFGQVHYEIAGVTRPQLVFGQVNDRIMTKCVCVPSREGQFSAGSESVEFDDRSHPVQDPQC